MILPPALVNAAWGWTGLDAAEVEHRNAFGNLIVRDQDGVLWRITPEDLTCAPLGLPVVPWQAEDFKRDWDMVALVEQAQAAHGPLPDAHAYHLVIPSVLGGAYSLDNIEMSTLASVHALAGMLAQQLEGLADGQEVRLAVLNEP